MQSLALIEVSDSQSPAIDEILPGLFLGNADAAKDLSLLKKNCITHIATAAVGDGVGKLFPSDFEYHEVCIADSSEADLCPFLEPCAAFIQSALDTASNRVFVHCMMGTSRSASLVLFYLMQRRYYTLRNALLHVMHVRSSNPRAPYTHPNRGFMKQLIACDKTLSAEQGRGGHASLTLNDYMSREFSSGHNISLGPVPEPKPPRAAAAKKVAAEQATAANAMHASGGADAAAFTAGALDK
jgi:hypothetical protein